MWWGYGIEMSPIPTDPVQALGVVGRELADHPTEGREAEVAVGIAGTDAVVVDGGERPRVRCHGSLLSAPSSSRE